MMIALRFFALYGLSAIIFWTAPAQANDQFYNGKTVAVVVPSSASGGYDSYSRLLARHMVKHIPGSAGVRAADYLFNIAPQDGTAIGMLEQALYLRQVLEMAGLRGDLKK